MNYNKKAEEIFETLTKRKKYIGELSSNISQGESGVLLYLLNVKSNVSQSELSEKLGVTMPRIVAVINTLQKKELIEKNVDSTDKRKSIISITNKGKDNIIKKKEDAIKFIENVIKELDEQEIEQYIAISKKIERISNKIEV
ncbi:MAG: MarR family transcriptional regulator [Clostridia bacterium]|nr:MarR family transcriptional regulator [Clostridia bacterium]